MPLATKKNDFGFLKDQARAKQGEQFTSTNAIKVVEADWVPGRHVFGNLYNIDRNIIGDATFLKKTIEECIAAGYMQLVEIKSWSIGGKKGGIAVIALIRESHVALHTWSEYNYATLDIYTSGTRADPNKAFDYVVMKLRPKRHQVFNVDRSQVDL